VLVLFFGHYGMCEMIIFLIEPKKIFYAGYPFGHILASYVVLPTVNGQASGSGIWVQPVGIGGTGYIKPV
jgi:hypothetical protein